MTDAILAFLTANVIPVVPTWWVVAWAILTHSLVFIFGYRTGWRHGANDRERMMREAYDFYEVGGSGGEQFYERGEGGGGRTGSEDAQKGLREMATDGQRGRAQSGNHAGDRATL